MLSKPYHGWTTISVGNIILGPASYIQDVPIDCLDIFLSYFSPENKLGFNFSFDAEGYSFGLIEFDSYLFSANENPESGSLDLKEIRGSCFDEKTNDLAEGILVRLANELVDDINNYMDEWVEWDLDYDMMSDDNKKKRKELLKSKVEALSSVLKKK